MTRDVARQRLAEAMAQIDGLPEWLVNDEVFTGILDVGMDWLDAILADPDTIERAAAAWWHEDEPVPWSSLHRQEKAELTGCMRAALAAIIPKEQP